MNNLRGAATLEVCGVKRYVKFGTNQTAIFCQVQGISIRQAQEIMAPEKLAANDVPPQVLIDFCYSAFAAGATAKRVTLDFDAFDVGEWIDQEPGLMEQVFSVASGANGPNEPTPTETTMTAQK